MSVILIWCTQADVLARMNQNLSRGLRAFDYHGTAPTSAVLVPLHRGTIAEPVAILQLYFPRNKFHVVNHGEVSSYYRELLQCHLIDFAFESDSIHLVLGDVALVCVASFLQEAREDTAVTTAGMDVCVFRCLSMRVSSFDRIHTQR